jgi:integrase
MKKKKPNTEEKQRRRPRGTGSMFRKPPCKRWVIQFYVKGRRVREFTGKEDYEEARKVLRERLHEIDQGRYVARQKGKALRVQDLYEDLKRHRALNPKTRQRDLPGRWKHLKPVFGHLLTADVTTDDVLQYSSDRLNKDKAKPATVNREIGALKRMFRLAMQSTPPKVQRVPHIPMLREDNARQGFVEQAEFDRMATQTGELWLRTYLELAYSYGWRRGELLGLRVEQVNLTTGTIRLWTGTTKNKDGREVTMTAKVTELLREAVRGKSKTDFVLTRKDGKPIKDFRAAWQNLCVAAGQGRWLCRPCLKNNKEIPVELGKTCPECETKVTTRTRKHDGLIPHDMRRSAAKAARRAGIPESVIMAAGGWRTDSVFRRYAIVSSADQKAYVEMLERARAEQARANPQASFTASFAAGEHAAAKGAKPN